MNPLHRRDYARAAFAAFLAIGLASCMPTPSKRTTSSVVTVTADLALVEPATLAHVATFFGADHVLNRYVNDTGYAVIDEGVVFRLELVALGTDRTRVVLGTEDPEAGKRRIEFARSLEVDLANRGFQIER